MKGRERDTIKFCRSRRSLTRNLMIRLPRLLPGLFLIAAMTVPAAAQLSFTTVIDLALRNSPQVKMAEADAAKALATLQQTRDVYIPAVVGGSALGASWSVPLSVPTVFSFTASSLVFSDSQHDYIRSARAGLTAANLALKNVREQVAEDAAITYISYDQAQQCQVAIAEEYGAAAKLVAIVQERLDAGQDTRMELLKSKRAVAQVRLQQLQMDDQAATLRDHLARITGISMDNVRTVPESIPPTTQFSTMASPSSYPDTPGVEAAFASAHAKREQAFGDARYSWRPQMEFAAQYAYISPFNNVETYYGPRNTNQPFNYNAVGIGVQIQLPVFDAGRRAKARASSADATHAEQEATYLRGQQFEGRLKLQHAATELAAQGDLAAVDQQIAQEDLDTTRIQLQMGTAGGGPPMTPKEEQNARITERQRYLDLLDAKVKLMQTQINLLRQTGELEQWLKAVSVDFSAPVVPTKH
jgi:outer membrane protein TolC